MVVLDLDYLDSVTEITSMHLGGGGKAWAFSTWFAGAYGESTVVITNAKNKAIAGEDSSTASSSVETAASGDDGTVVGAYSSAFAST